MDYTYFMAGLIALVVGLVAGVVFVTSRGRSKLRLLAIASGIAFVLDWALLINWKHGGEMSVELFLSDVLFFAIYSIIGCMMGVSPALVARYLWRKYPRPSNSNRNTT